MGKKNYYKYLFIIEAIWNILASYSALFIEFLYNYKKL